MRHHRYIRHTTPRSSDYDLRTARRVILDALKASIQRVHRHPSSRTGVYIGSAGTILMDWRISSLPEITAQSPSPSSFSMSLSRAPSGSHASFLETSVGSATLILIQQLHNASSGARPGHRRTSSRVSSKAWEACAELIQHAVRIAINEAVDDDGCEVLYGRSGLLYSLLLLRSDLLSRGAASSDMSTPDEPIVKVVSKLSSDANVKALVDDIIRRGIVGAESYAHDLEGEEKERTPPLMWSWHGKRYLGAAHGVAGILQLLISVPANILTQEQWELILHTVNWLIDIQLPSGNWPTKAVKNMRSLQDDDDKNQLVQWCHGAPGVLILLSTLLRRFARPNYPASNSPLVSQITASARTALIRGGDVVYVRGLLRKGVGLCHGVSGSIFTLLSVSDALSLNHIPTDPDHSISSSAESVYTHIGDIKVNTWFMRALHLAQLATAYEDLTRRGEMNVPDRPYSLYEGVAGMCCAWVEVIRRLDRAMFRDGGGNGDYEDMGVGHGIPGYDDLKFLG